MRDENGLEKCVACGLCAVACPADAIYLEAAENDGIGPGRSALREGLPDPQDALHLLRLLRRGLPGVGDLHGQGLRARGLQQQGLHLGQDGPARPGRARPRSRRDRVLRRARRHPRRISPASRRDHASAHPDVPFWLCVGDVADARRPLRAVAAPLYWIKEQRELRSRSRPAICPPVSIHPERTADTDGSGRGRDASPVSAARSRRRCTSCRPASLPHPKKGTAEGDRSWRIGGAISSARKSRRARRCAESTCC